MCGIVGIWNLEGSPIDKPMLDQFTDSLAHRGPDGRGTYTDPHVSLGMGHRRLAILDLSPTGHQPMSFADKRYWITYNGEIYNFIEIRDELEGLGRRFASDSDTEVILAAYDQWGEDCQFKLNGMWGFAIWDSKERVLFLSRDRFGVKPLHYYYDGTHFAFASEMKSFLSLEWFRPVFNPYVVATALKNVMVVEGTEECLLEGMKRLRGGHSLTLRQGQEPKVRRWWNTLEHIKYDQLSFSKQVEQFRDLFFNACKIRMRSDVPIGTALSGGLDSSSVLCTMAQIKSRFPNEDRLADNWQKSFISVFPGTIQDERSFAEQVVSHTGTIPIFREIDSSELVDSFDNVIFQFEEIYDMPSAPWFIYREMRNHGIVVSIDGHGGDELAAGYPWHPDFAMLDALEPWPRPLRLLELRSTLKHMYPEVSAVRNPALREIAKLSLVKKLHNWPAVYNQARFIHRSVKKQRHEAHDYWSRVESHPTGFLDHLLKLDPHTASFPEHWLHVKPHAASFPDFEKDLSMVPYFDNLNKRLYYDFHFEILPTVLRNFDRLSMAHGVEIRAPFMDWRLVCHGFSLPSMSKMKKGFTKRILREAMQGVLPESVRTRTSKLGFANPTDDWSKGPFKSFTLDSVNTRTFLDSDVWNGPAIRDFAEGSFARSDYAGARGSWIFIQAMRLMELFKKQSAAHKAV